MICLVKNFNLIISNLFISERKVNISLVFITRSSFAVPKNIRLNSTHYFVMEVPNKGELQSFISIDSQDFMNLYKKCTAKPYSYIVIDTTFASDDPIRFLERIFKINQSINK